MRRLLAAISILTIAACSPGGDAVPTASPSPAPTSATAMPSPSPTAPPPVPAPVRPGSARSQVIVVQRAEDASLVSGGDPIRLTLARTQNEASWFTGPPQRLAGTMTTEQALLSLGWRPAEDGTTAQMPQPGPAGLLATTDGDLAFSVLRANVRPDGTLVLDIRPVGTEPPTASSLGPVVLTLDGVAGAVDVVRDVAPGLSTRVIVTGRRNQQAVVQVIGPDGVVQQSTFVAVDVPTARIIGEVEGTDVVLSDIEVTLVAPGRERLGSVTLSARLTAGDQESNLSQVIARWSRPASSAR